MTYYVSLVYWLPIESKVAYSLSLPTGNKQQHKAWWWMSPEQAVVGLFVHENVRMVSKLLRKKSIDSYDSL